MDIILCLSVSLSLSSYFLVSSFLFAGLEETQSVMTAEEDVNKGLRLVRESEMGVFCRKNASLSSIFLFFFLERFPQPPYYNLFFLSSSPFFSALL